MGIGQLFACFAPDDMLAFQKSSRYKKIYIKKSQLFPGCFLALLRPDGVLFQQRKKALKLGGKKLTLAHYHVRWSTQLQQPPVMFLCSSAGARGILVLVGRMFYENGHTAGAVRTATTAKTWLESARGRGILSIVLFFCKVEKKLFDVQALSILEWNTTSIITLSAQKFQFKNSL